MPNPLTSVTLTGTDYTDAATILGVWGDKDGRNGGGTFNVLDANVFYQLAYPQYGSGFGLYEWTPDVPLTPYGGIIPNTAVGIRFRNQDAASQATVSAYIAPPGQPILALNSANTVTQGTASMITGTVPATGTTPTSGTGFTYTHVNGSGIYVFTFTAAFANPPTVELTMIQVAGTGFINLQAVPSTTGFTVLTWNTAAAAADRAFSFVAHVTN